MAYEIKDWKEAGCSLSIETVKLSNREVFSKEINEKFGEGGGLNADYQIVEAVAVASSLLGHIGLKYGEDFIFKTAGSGEISFDFRDKATKDVAEKAFQKI